MDPTQPTQQNGQNGHTDWPKTIEDWADRMLATLNSEDCNLKTCKCTDIKTTEGLVEHITAQSLDQENFDDWLWHGGYLDQPWIEHSPECSQSTDQIMQSLESLTEFTGVPKNWWTVLQDNGDASSLVASGKKGTKSKGGRRRETMYQGDDKTLDALFATDIGDATLNFAALGFIAMPKTLVHAYASSWSVFTLCELGTDYQETPMRNLRHSWAISLQLLSPQFSSSRWIREVYVPTIIGIVLRKAMARRPYLAVAAAKDPLAWCAARVLQGGSQLAAGVELSRLGIFMDDKSRFLQAVTLVLGHDLFEEDADVSSGDTPNVTPGLRQLLGCDGQTAYTALLCSDMIHYSMKRCCVGWTFATLKGQRWAKSLQAFDFSSVKYQKFDIASAFGATPLGEDLSTWRRCDCGDKKIFPDNYTLHDLSGAARTTYLESPGQCDCWCAHDRAYDIISENFLAGK